MSLTSCSFPNHLSELRQQRPRALLSGRGGNFTAPLARRPMEGSCTIVTSPQKGENATKRGGPGKAEPFRTGTGGTLRMFLNPGLRRGCVTPAAHPRSRRRCCSSPRGSALPHENTVLPSILGGPRGTGGPRTRQCQRFPAGAGERRGGNQSARPPQPQSDRRRAPRAAAAHWLSRGGRAANQRRARSGAALALASRGGPARGGRGHVTLCLHPLSCRAPPPPSRPVRSRPVPRTGTGHRTDRAPPTRGCPAPPSARSAVRPRWAGKLSCLQFSPPPAPRRVSPVPLSAGSGARCGTGECPAP